MNEQVQPLCYLCGIKPGNTRDHVFPQLLFAHGSNFTNLPRRLPACENCNNALSKDEAVFQQLILSWRTIDTEEGRKLYETKAKPHIRDESRRLRETIRNLSKFYPVLDESGTVLGAWPVMEVDRGIVDRVLGKMVKGLYTHETGNVLPPEVEISVHYGGQNPDEFHRVILPDLLAKSERFVVGSEDVLVGHRAVVPDNPLFTITWLVFYRWHIFCVITKPPDA
jgi:hypothetical protein